MWDAFGFDKGGQLTRSLGESCEWQIDVDGATQGSVRIGPGSPDDFEQGASLDGLTSSESLDGIGAAALWFVGDGTGVLSVVQDTDLGYQFYRLAVDQPELDGSALKAMATDFAAIAGPRFPGTETQAGGSGSADKPCNCAPSDYYEFRENLQEWIKRIFAN